MQVTFLINATFFLETANQISLANQPITLNATFAPCSLQMQHIVRHSAL